MPRLNIIFRLVLGGLLLLPAMPAAHADATSGSVITCLPTRGASCDAAGQCRWRAASERDRQQVLELDFKLMDAVMVFGGKRRKFGKIVDVQTGDGKRDVVISRRGKNDPKTNMVLKIVKGGKFTGWRANKRVRFEGVCKPA
jgi:hypothetical protein